MAMILIHGECGSGRTPALRALEAAPPAGFRAVYVPVPTLDLEGVARWSRDRLARHTAGEPIAALRELAKRQPLLLLLDDADSLPAATAAALAQFAWESAGAITLIAACETGARTSPALVALGAPERQIALDASSPERAQNAARAVCEHIAPALRPAPNAPASASARPGRRVVAPAPRVAVVASSAPAATPAREVATPPPAAPSLRGERRTVPLGLAIALAVTAFLVPVAFGAGLWLGRSAPAEPSAAATSPREPALPAVAAAPPLASEVVTEAPLPIANEPEPPARESATPLPSPAPPSASAAATTPLEAPEVEAARAPERTASAPIEPPGPSPDILQSEPAAEAEEDWGAPALLSVAPGEGGR
jgi:hypothetical protein